MLLGSFFKPAKSISTQDARSLFTSLSAYKSIHKNDLRNLYQRIAENAAEDGFPELVLPHPPADVVAGCVSVPEAVKWSRDKKKSDILELMMSLEANTLDLYLKLGRQVQSERAQSVFIELTEQEKNHLDKLAVAFEKSL